MSEHITDFETRKKRALYRANHRGIKEMDIIIGKFAEGTLKDMTEAELNIFEEFLNISDRELEGWIMRDEYNADGEFASLVDQVRTFHNII
ncbi:MAG: succinate dehydrogenase assembly factor 2 [Pseudomonadota bacterium]